MRKVYLKIYNEQECQIDKFDLGNCEVDDGKDYAQDIIQALQKSEIILFAGDSMCIEVEE